MRWSPYVVLAACAIVPGTAAAQNDIPASSDHPLFPRLANYYIWSYSSGEPEQEPFRNASGGRDTVEGKVTRVRYGYRRAAGTPPTTLAIQRHYRDIVLRNGGTIMLEGRYGELYGRFVADGREYFVGETIESGSEFNVAIAERPAPAAAIALPSGARGAPVTAVATGPVVRPAGVLARGTPLPQLNGAPRLNLAPVITGVAPSARQAGELVRLAGNNLEHPVAVRFIDSRGTPWPAQVFSFEACSDNLKVVVPVIPAGTYRIEVQSALGTGQSPGDFNVFQTPVAGGADAQQKLRVALRRTLDTLGRRNLLTAANVATLKQRVTMGQYTAVGQALDAFQDVMVSEAEAAVGGPVNESIVVIAMKTGKPVREIAMQWRHCHVVQREYGIGTMGGTATAGVGIGSPPRGEGAILSSNCSAGTAGARWHSHVTPMTISDAVMVQQAIAGGTAPSSIAAHYHTETGFAAGTVWYASLSNDAWYRDFVDGAMNAVDWLDEHSDTIISVAKIAGYAVMGTVGCAVGLLFTAGAGCAASFIAVAGPIAKETAKILVQEEVVTVDGVDKQTLIAGIDAIPVG